MKTTPIYRPLSLDDSLQKNGQEEDESINLACHSEPVDATNMRKEIDQSIEIEEATDDVEKGNNVFLLLDFILKSYSKHCIYVCLFY